MIKLFKIKSFAYTPFENEKDKKYLMQNGILVTNKIKEADILVVQNLKHLKKYVLQYFATKKFLIWTLEPRFNTSFKKSRKYLGLKQVHFMNIYTGDVFTSPTTFHSRLIKKKLNPLNLGYKFQTRKIVALMSYYDGESAPPLNKEGKNIDLIGLRSQIALIGNRRKVMDIYGKGWPKNISIEDSRFGNWTKRKEEVLLSYSFNLCFENTIAHNYVTEKIWDSIGNYCLPIYYGEGTNIYSLFPQNSFIDYSQCKSPSDLFDLVEKISEEDYVDRMNKCIYVYNSISERGDFFEWEERKRSLDKIIEKCNSLVPN